MHPMIPYPVTKIVYLYSLNNQEFKQRADSFFSFVVLYIYNTPKPYIINKAYGNAARFFL